MSNFEVRDCNGELLGHYQAEDAYDAKEDAAEEHGVEVFELEAIEM